MSSFVTFKQWVSLLFYTMKPATVTVSVNSWLSWLWYRSSPLHCSPTHHFWWFQRFLFFSLCFNFVPGQGIKTLFPIFQFRFRFFFGGTLSNFSVPQFKKLTWWDVCNVEDNWQDHVSRDYRGVSLRYSTDKVFLCRSSEKFVIFRGRSTVIPS